jgi:Ca2+-binding EF-hand superfamily protein
MVCTISLLISHKSFFSSGIVDFNEFLLAIALTMSGMNQFVLFLLSIFWIIGELKDRLDLAFSMYDINGDGVLDKKELS